MDFGLNADQEALQNYARDFLAKECPTTRVREAMEGNDGHDRELWTEMAELGWQGLAIPEEHGGTGMSYLDLACLFEEIGRAVVPGPFFASVALGTTAILEAGSAEQQAKYLPELSSGAKIATLAYTESTGRVDAGGITLKAEKSGEGYKLNGTKMFVPDAHIADYMIVAGRVGDGDGPEGVTLFVVDSSASGIKIDQLKTMDTTRRWCEVVFENVSVPAENILGTEGGGWAPLETTTQKAIALLCAESVGAAQKVLDLSVEYAKQRVQFGRPIGSFQAVKHKCAEMLVDVEMSRSAMYYAAWAASDGADELRLASSVAKSYCSDAFSRVAADGIQVHGGIGFTWEHDMHIYFKRAKASEMLLGDPGWHREQVAQLVS